MNAKFSLLFSILIFFHPQLCTKHNCTLSPILIREIGLQMRSDNHVQGFIRTRDPSDPASRLQPMCRCLRREKKNRNNRWARLQIIANIVFITKNNTSNFAINLIKRRKWLSGLTSNESVSWVSAAHNWSSINPSVLNIHPMIDRILNPEFTPWVWWINADIILVRVSATDCVNIVRSSIRGGWKNNVHTSPKARFKFLVQLFFRGLNAYFNL